MRHFATLAVVFAMALSMEPLAQEHHGSMNSRGAAVMGFDQNLTVHHFLLYPDGGAIDVAVRDHTDTTDLAAIRTHLPHIATMFGDGDFAAPMLVHDSAHVPGTAVMAARKDRIRFRYLETTAGGRVDIVTHDPEALAAVHDFLRFQIADHHTGDPITVTPR